jgi:hypothetical protein
MVVSARVCGPDNESSSVELNVAIANLSIIRLSGEPLTRKLLTLYPTIPVLVVINPTVFGTYWSSAVQSTYLS